MRLSIFCTALLMAALTTPVSAQDMQAINNIHTIQIKDGKISLTYKVGGGCSEHAGLLRVALEETANANSYLARVFAYDVTDKADECEAMITVKATGDIKELVQQAAARQDINPENLKDVYLQLPAQSFLERNN